MGSVKGEQMPRLRFVLTHMGNQSLDVIELLLVPDEGVKRDLDLSPVKIPGKVEEVRFEQFLWRLERRTDAKARNAGMLASIVESHAHGVDAVSGSLIVAERHVRSRVTELTPAAVAALDDPFHREIAAEEPRRSRKIAGLERLADPPRGDPRRPKEHRRHRLGDDAVLLAKSPKHEDVALSAAAESEIIPGDDTGGADLAGKDLADKILARSDCEGLVELEDEHRIRTGVGEQDFPLVEARKPEGRDVRLEEAHRVRIEGGDDHRTALVESALDCPPDHCLVAKVETVEVAEGDNTPLKTLGDAAGEGQALHCSGP